MLGRSNGYQIVHFDFYANGEPYPLPSNIASEVAKFQGHRVSRGDYALTDATIVIVFRKRFSMDFVAPIDVNTGARTNDAKLLDRYWTTFRPEPFGYMEKR